jgi:hypothetical protein
MTNEECIKELSDAQARVAELERLAKDSIDNRDKLMAELKVAVEKCVELERERDDLKAKLREKENER